MKTKVICPKCNLESWTVKSFGEIIICEFCGSEILVKEKVTIEVV